MPKILKFYAPLIFSIVIALFIIPLAPAYASEDEEPAERKAEEERIEKGDVDEYSIEEVIDEEGADLTPIGIVDSIEIEGKYRVKESVILRQLTFDIGEEITQADLERSRKSLLRMNGLLWHAAFEVEPAAEEGHINLILTVNSRRTWHITPAQSGAALGDRNFFGTGKGVGAGFFSVGDTTLAYIHYTDPQFLGGHQRMMYEIHLIEGNIVTRTDMDFSAGEQYRIEKRGGYLRYSTRWKDKVHVAAMLRMENISTDPETDPYQNKFEDDTFYLSKAWIPDGTLVTWSLGLGQGSYNSVFFPTKGYTLWFNQDHSYEFLGSDFNFSRYSLRGTKYYGLDSSNKHSLALKAEYGLATGSDFPHYELPVVDFQIRGMGGASDRGKSYAAFSAEYRFYVWPDVVQCAVFIDSGRAWDDIAFNFNDYQTSYGVGARYQAFKHWGFNVLIRFDYSLGPYDQRWYIGLGQPF